MNDMTEKIAVINQKLKKRMENYNMVILTY